VVIPKDTCDPSDAVQAVPDCTLSTPQPKKQNPDHGTQVPGRGSLMSCPTYAVIGPELTYDYAVVVFRGGRLLSRGEITPP
jgi:hypothetical protein